jgi:hypothetical protein
MPTIRLDDETDRWRWVCPRGHRTWEPTNGHFWCQRCAQAHDDEAEPVFYELRDQETGETVDRDDLRLVSGFETDERRGSA